MIKQNFSISSDEVVRILQMHENATKNHYLIKEQVKKTTELAPKEFSLPAQTFKSGYHTESSLDPSQKQAIESVLNQMANYIKEKKGIPMGIQIVTGESIPTNYDKENNKTLGKGELAKLRGETIKNILTNFFQGLVDKKLIPSMPQIPEPKTNVELKMKQVPYVKGTDSPTDKKYEADQFIKFSIVSSGKETTECLVGLNVRFLYINQEASNERPCRGGHTCNDARFDVYLNKTLIGVADLNNLGCTGQECNRQSNLVVTQEMVNSIVNQPSFDNKLMLWYKCKSANCHSSVPEIYIYNDKKTLLFPNSSFPNPCVAPMASRGDQGSKVLMFLDGCGNPVNVDQTTSAAEMKKLGDEMTADANAEKEKQEALTRVEQEKIAKQKQIEVENQQKFLNDVQTIGLNFVPGKVNTNVFDKDFYDIVEQVNQGNSLLLTVIPKQNGFIQYFMNPYTNKLVRYNAKKEVPFKVIIPIIPISTKEKQSRFIRDNSLVPIGNELYFAPSQVAGTKNTMGAIISPTFE